VADVLDPVVVVAVVDEHPKRHADLVGGQAHALGGVHRGEHVVTSAASAASNSSTGAHGWRSTGLPTIVMGRAVPESSGSWR